MQLHQMKESALHQQNKNLNIQQIMKELNEKSPIPSKSSRDFFFEALLRGKGTSENELSGDQNDMEFRNKESGDKDAQILDDESSEMTEEDNWGVQREGRQGEMSHTDDEDEDDSDGGEMMPIPSIF